MDKRKLDRINELAQKQKTEGLSEDEKIEQKFLREEFLQDFRGRFSAQLKNIEIVEPDDPRLLAQRRKQNGYTKS